MVLDQVANGARFLSRISWSKNRLSIVNWLVLPKEGQGMVKATRFQSIEMITTKREVCATQGQLRICSRASASLEALYPPPSCVVHCIKASFLFQLSLRRRLLTTFSS